MDSAKLFLRENPFPASPSSDRYLPIGSIEAARQRLTDAIDRREGPGLLVGPSGTGKSLLCSLIAAAYRDEFDVVLLAESRLCTRRALLQHLLHHLGLPYSDQTEGELRLALIDRAASGGPANHAGLLIIVDEAHTLPSRLLEELRMMSGIVRNGNPRVQMVLAGGPSLDERFAHPRMEAFSQRIGTRCYLHPLGQLETGKYIRDAIRQAGADPQMIDDEAIGAVYYAADGIPRLINQTMRRSVALAESEGQPRISAETVQRAWADLQQLPSPISGPSAATRVRDVVAESVATLEFGTLDEADSDRVGHEAWDAEGLTSDSPSYEPSTEEAFDERAWPTREVDPMAETLDYEPLKPQRDSRQTAAELVYEETTAEETSAETGEIEAAEPVQCVNGGECSDGCRSPQYCPRAAESGSSDAVAGAAEHAEDARALVAADVITLFGDGFDEEESLSPGFGPSCTTTVGYRLSDGEAGEEDAESIEQEIHREIVSINSEAIRSEPRLHCNQPTDERTTRETATAADAGFAAGDITVQDDSHMLVIEDDVELDAHADAFPPRGPRAPAAPEDEISLQSMFSRLREG